MEMLMTTEQRTVQPVQLSAVVLPTNNDIPEAPENIDQFAHYLQPPRDLIGQRPERINRVITKIKKYLNLVLAVCTEAKHQGLRQLLDRLSPFWRYDVFEAQASENIWSLRLGRQVLRVPSHYFIRTEEVNA